MKRGSAKAFSLLLALSLGSFTFAQNPHHLRIKNIILESQNSIPLQARTACESRVYFWSLAAALEGIPTDAVYVAEKGRLIHNFLHYHVALMYRSREGEDLVADPWFYIENRFRVIQTNDSDWIFGSVKDWLHAFMYREKAGQEAPAKDLETFMKRPLEIEIAVGASHLFKNDFLSAVSSGNSNGALFSSSKVKLKNPLSASHALPPLPSIQARACNDFYIAYRSLRESVFMWPQGPDRFSKFARYALALFRRARDQKLLYDQELPDKLKVPGQNNQCLQVLEQDILQEI